MTPAPALEAAADHAACTTIFGILESQYRQRSESIAISNGDGTAISYSDLFTRVRALITSFRACGVERNSRVAIVLPNGTEMAVSLLAVSSMAASVPLNPAYRKDEFRAYFDEMNIAALLTIRGFPSEAREVADETGLKVIELSDDGCMTVTMAGKTVASDPDDMDEDWSERTSGPDDIAMVLLTSGSTGRSKKVPLSNRNVCVATANICRTMELTAADRCLCMWEQFHVGGLVDLLLVPLASGGTVICAGSFDAARFYAMLGPARPTWFQGVPTTLNELLVHARRNDVDPKAAPLRFIRSVAAPLSVQLMGEIEDLFEVPVIQTLGMTEAAPLITTNLLPPHKRKPGSVGKTSGPEIRLVGPDWSDVPRGETGEVMIRGDNVFSGYEDAPEANAHAFRGGWFRTGDTGYFDEDDYLFLTGRLKEMINRGGEKITPQEIDDVLTSHPQIAQAASFSIEHRTLGEDVAAAIVLKIPGAVSEQNVRAFVGEHLAEFKVPRKILILDEMPRDPIGKVNRASLANLAATMQQAEAPAAGTETDTEQQLAVIWAEELGLKTVGRDDNFFELGGDSLSGVRLVLAVQEAFGRQLPTSVLATHPTLREMAVLLDSDAPEPDGTVEEAGSPDGLSTADIRMMSLVMGAGRIPR